MKLNNDEHYSIPLPEQGSEDCQTVSSVIARIGDKWSLQIIVLLGSGTKRFNEIKRTVNGVSQRMLTLTLRGLERDGLVNRTIFPTVPPRVDYELTELGKSLWLVIEPLGEWAISHVNEIKLARKQFDSHIADLNH